MTMPPVAATAAAVSSQTSTWNECNSRFLALGFQKVREFGELSRRRSQRL
jgi:hypothetical protein